MKRDEAIELVRVCIGHIQPDGFDTATVREDMRLIGGNSPLDSIALVSLIMEVEQRIAEEFDVHTSLTDDRAMSEKRSPFRTVGTLVDLIIARLA